MKSYVTTVICTRIGRIQPVPAPSSENVPRDSDFLQYGKITTGIDVPNTGGEERTFLIHDCGANERNQIVIFANTMDMMDILICS